MADDSRADGDHDDHDADEMSDDVSDETSDEFDDEDDEYDEYDDAEDEIDDEDDDRLEPIALIARVALVALLLTGIGAAAFVLFSDDDDGNRTQFASSPIEDADEASAETSADDDAAASGDDTADEPDGDDAAVTGDDTTTATEDDAAAADDDNADVDDAASAGDTAERQGTETDPDAETDADDTVSADTDADDADDTASADNEDDASTTDDVDTATEESDDDAATDEPTGDTGDTAGDAAADSGDVPAAVDTDSPRPTSAELSYATLPDGQPVPVLAMFDDDRIVLEGAVPSEEAAAFLRDLALLNSQFPDIPVEDRLEINPDVPATVGVRVLELNSPRFPTSSSVVSPEHAAQLDRLVPVLQALPNVETLVIGHADQRGDPAANYVLSTQRAQSVVDYLVFKGVAPDRLSARAVGENDLLSMAEDMDSLELNRRTEFVLTGLLLGM